MPRAECGPGARPETGIQGRVSRADHESGLAAQGLLCNTELVGQHSVIRGRGGSVLWACRYSDSAVSTVSRHASASEVRPRWTRRPVPGLLRIDRSDGGAAPPRAA